MAVQRQKRENDGKDARFHVALNKHKHREKQGNDRARDAEVLGGKGHKHARKVRQQAPKKAVNHDNRGGGGDAFPTVEAAPVWKIMADGAAKTGVHGHDPPVLME